ncbi:MULTISPECIES: aa3-type cytochrome oxidase subunit IV [Streptomyces]|uniref:cytochrome-c oxidase n=1 Tax=Streptomyces morookaense TaxID=1970 RepID=A0A7Y7AZW7_STRMO|nr:MULTISPECIES: cytochrome c oxidase subunit 4 [Streptomyces]MCC2274465.1 cytochrome c oxidase subunit 4 [Streptomyces sp. ET3-23]NVK76460.1 cytochrome c oxidase subunit 4 [Streptomyces morookaense]GHF07257.1 cytochrome c oxidase polypeptide 4 [Streptomyces morookaense]
MKTEAFLFSGVAAFFLVTDVAYIWWSGKEPAGGAALTVSFLMASVIAFFCAMNHRRKGRRPEDRPDSEIHERAGVVDFFPPQSGYPPLTALGATLLMLGIVFGLWLFIAGAGITMAGIIGMALQFVDAGD